jgi:2-keto-3-deoxy-galactonokinase
MAKPKPQVVIVKRTGSKWEAVGMLSIIAAMIGPNVGWFETPQALLIGSAGFVVFLIGRFL